MRRVFDGKLGEGDWEVGGGRIARSRGWCRSPVTLQPFVRRGSQTPIGAP
jgi:hypothetical protein